MRTITLLAIATALVPACTDVELQPVYFPGVVEGEYCTEAADTYDIPIRILLVIDTSRSMEINDPEGFRGRAVADLVTVYSGNENVSFGFVTSQIAMKSAKRRARN